jgi:phosphatidate cytidylyltransferase
MLRKRFITAVIALALLLAVLFVAPANVAEAVIALVILGGAWEWSRFLQARSKAVQFTYIAVVALLMVAFAGPLAAYKVLVLQVALAWWLIAFGWCFFYPTPIPAPVRWLSGTLVLVPAYIALIALYRIGPLMLLFALLIVWAADMGAYFAGKAFGKVKLAPAISPGKTWEGVIGGLVLVVALVVGRSFFVASNLAAMIPFCLAVAGISIVGDLTVSMLKRTTGVKDSGSLFPGHGGILDRIDSVTAAAPLFALGVGWLGLS